MGERRKQWARTLALLGSSAGLAGGLFLGGIRVANSEGPLWRVAWPGSLAFAVVYAAPFFLSLLVWWRGARAQQTAVWAAAAFLGVAGFFTAFSGVTVVLLPGAILLALAALLTLPSLPGRALPGVFLLAALLALILGGAWFALFSRADAGLCWEQVRAADGSTTWRARPYEQGDQGPVVVIEEGAGVVQVTCSSDIIDNGEALLAFLAVVAGLLLGWRAPTLWNRNPQIS
jgi:hypothetical protein